MHGGVKEKDLQHKAEGTALPGSASLPSGQQDTAPELFE